MKILDYLKEIVVCEGQYEVTTRANRLITYYLDKPVGFKKVGAAFEHVGSHGGWVADKDFKYKYYDESTKRTMFRSDIKSSDFISFLLFGPHNENT